MSDILCLVIIDIISFAQKFEYTKQKTSILSKANEYRRIRTKISILYSKFNESREKICKSNRVLELSERIIIYIYIYKKKKQEANGESNNK